MRAADFFSHSTPYRLFYVLDRAHYTQGLWEPSHRNKTKAPQCDYKGHYQKLAKAKAKERYDTVGWTHRLGTALISWAQGFCICPSGRSLWWWETKITGWPSIWSSCFAAFKPRKKRSTSLLKRGGKYIFSTDFFLDWFFIWMKKGYIIDYNGSSKSCPLAVCFTDIEALIFPSHPSLCRKSE